MKKLADISAFENLNSHNSTVFNASKRYGINNTVWKYRKLSGDADPRQQLSLARAQRCVNVLASIAAGMGTSVMELIALLEGGAFKAVGSGARMLGKGLEYMGTTANKGLRAFGGVSDRVADEVLLPQGMKFFDNLDQKDDNLRKELKKGNAQVRKAKTFLR